MSDIHNQFINTNLFSGSSDLVRTTLGGYWEISDDADNMEFVALGNSSPVEDSGRSVEQNFISRVVTDSALSTTSSADLSVPNIKIPIRLVGDENNVFTDAQWKAVITGGTYSTSSYAGIFTNSSFIDLSFERETPYSPIYIKQTDNNNIGNYTLANFSYEYNAYLPDYQSLIEQMQFISIPNYYFILSHQLGYKELEDEIINNHVTLLGSIDADNLLSPVSTIYPPTYDIESSDLDPTTSTFIDKKENYQNYLTGTLPSASVDIITDSSFASLCTNLIFNRRAQQTLFADSLSYKDILPYSVKLGLPYEIEEGNTTFFDMIEAAGYEDILMLNIKNNFVDNAGELDTIEYTNMTTSVSASSESIAVEEKNIDTASFRYINLYEDILNTLIGSNDSRDSNFYLPGGQASTREELINNQGVYRYKNSISSLNLLKNINDFIETDPVFSNDIEQLEDFLNLAKENKYNEVLAYRIAKQEVVNPEIIQNFYISNTSNLLDSTENRDGLTIYDSQIKYGNSYTYTAFAYVLTYGYAYRYGDLVISKQIAERAVDLGVTSGAGVEIDPTLAYCLEFYDPTTGEIAERLVYNDGTERLSDTSEEEVFTEGLADNFFFTNAQLASYNKFLADFNISIEPTIKLIEVPIYTKTLTVIDHPPAQLDVQPFQRMDGSGILGFLTNLKAFTPDTFPRTLTELESSISDAYLVSNDMIDTEKVKFPSRSKTSSISILRKSERPETITDFDLINDLAGSRSLEIEGSKYTLSNAIYEEKVLTNRKYYYILRTVNENGILGQITNVIQAELVDDGGYKYSLFEELFEDDFQEQIPSQVSKELKKIFEVIPNINQLEFDDSEVNYDNDAFEEISNVKVGSKDDSIFDKTFKIRLTSRKTGKMIDLNVTYKLLDM